MAKAPTRYYVEWMDGDAFDAEQERQAGNADPSNFTRHDDFENLKSAQAFKNIKVTDGYAAIYERSNIFDTTPKELRRLGVTWYSASFDEEMVED